MTAEEKKQDDKEDKDASTTFLVSFFKVKPHKTQNVFFLRSNNKNVSVDEKET